MTTGPADPSHPLQNEGIFQNKVIFQYAAKPADAGFAAWRGCGGSRPHRLFAFVERGYSSVTQPSEADLTFLMYL